MRKAFKKVLSGMMAVVLMSASVTMSDVKTMKAEDGMTAVQEEITCEQNITGGKNAAMITSESVTIGDVEYHNYVKYNGISAKASTEISSADDAIDGKMDSRWESVQGVDGQNLTINLGNIYKVKRVSACWEAASAKKYTLQVSTDGKNFQDITVVESTIGERTEVLTLSAEVDARYIRFDCESRNTVYGFSIFEVGVFGSEEQKEALTELDNLEVKNYYEYSGKYMLYFDEETGATGYNVYLDNQETPVKTVTSSGDYLDASDVEGLSEGTHTVRVVSLDAENNEKTEVTKAFTKMGEKGTYTDIAQVYIYTEKEIDREYHANKDVTVTVVDKKGSKTKDLIAINSNIKIRGNTTANAPKKPYNIKLDKKQAILGMGKAKKWCLLANSFDKSLMRNYLSYNFGRENGCLYTNNNRYVEVYVNGAFQGNYLLTEAVEAKKERVNVDAYVADSNDVLLELGHRVNETDVDHFTTNVLGTTFDINDPERGDDLTDEQVDAKIANVKAYLEGFEQTLKTQNYDDILEYIDEDSFVNFYIVNELFKNVDFNFSSTRFFIKENKIYAGPMWDLDLSSGNCKSTMYTGYYGADGLSYTGYYCQDMNWYRELLKNQIFMGKVKARYEELQYKIQSIFREDSVEEISIEKAVETYGASFERNFKSKAKLGAGWELDNEDGFSLAAEAGWETWQEPIEFLRNWLQNRNEWLCEEWGIDPKVAYEETEPNTVYVEINGSQISTLYEGYRIVYSVNKPELVTSVGMVYGLSDYISNEDMVVGSTAETVYAFEGSADGELSTNFSKRKNAQSYAMTMKNIKNAEFYNTKISVRAYAVLEDGSIVYSDVKKMTVYNTADYLYQNLKMNNLSGHEYLYNEILSVANPVYQKKDFIWSSATAPMED